MNLKDYINSNVSEYKKNLLAELAYNSASVNVINLFFFSAELDIQTWVEGMPLKTFNVFRYKSDFFYLKYCEKADIDNVDNYKMQPNFFSSRHEIFTYKKFRPIEDATNDSRRFYHIVHENVHEIIDDLIFSKLSGYKKNGHSVYTKKIGDDVEIILSTEREYVFAGDICDYRMPRIQINIKDNDSICMGKLDVRTLLFLPGDSFSYFYHDANNFSIDFQTRRVLDIKRKTDEPVIYFSENEHEYILSNKVESIDRYNKYIQHILDLSLHYFNFFEVWLTNLLNNCNKSR
jgi:hypothetical protein